MASSGVKAIISLAFLGCMAGLLIVLSCALYSAWWPLISLIPIVLSPIPTKLANKQTDVFSTSGSSVGYEVAVFLTTGAVVSGFGIPIVLAHAGKIVWPAVGLSMAGTFLGFVTLLVYRLAMPDDSDGFELMRF